MLNVEWLYQVVDARDTLIRSVQGKVTTTHSPKKDPRTSLVIFINYHFIFFSARSLKIPYNQDGGMLLRMIHM